MEKDRRDFMKLAGATLATSALTGLANSTAAQTAATVSPTVSAGELTTHTLPKLPYAYDALEPHIDARTMEIHHSKHHQAYVDGLNKAEQELAKARGAGDFALVQHWSRQLAFQYGGHALHNLFWSIMTPAGQGGEVAGILGDKIARDFGSVELFRKQFSEAAIRVEGSGWALLHYRPEDDRLVIAQAENQQKMAHWNAVTILGIDVWEHAYYLKYQNRRAEYVTAWWNVVNWHEVGRRLQAATR